MERLQCDCFQLRGGPTKQKPPPGLAPLMQKGLREETRFAGEKPVIILIAYFTVFALTNQAIHLHISRQSQQQKTLPSKKKSNSKRRFPPLTLQTNFTNDSKLEKGAYDGDGTVSQTPRPSNYILYKEAKPSSEHVRPSNVTLNPYETNVPYTTSKMQESADCMASTASLSQETGTQPTTSRTAKRKVEQKASAATENVAPARYPVRTSKGSLCRTCSDEFIRCPGGHPRYWYCVERNLICVYKSLHTGSQ